MKHSGISYGEIDTKRPPTQAELREALLISATFAEDEYQWPAHSQPDGKQLTIKLYGPFVPGETDDLLGPVGPKQRCRSEKRRVGKEGVSKYRFRWRPET